MVTPAGRLGRLRPRDFIGIAIAAAVLIVGSRVQRRYRPTEPPPPAPGAGPIRLTDATAEAGIRHVHQALVVDPSIANVGPLILANGGGPGASVVDFDGDGWPDLYLTNSAKGSRNALLRNNGDGTFTDVSAGSGIDDVNRESGSIRALFFDYDNDGREDLLLTTTYCPKLFHNEGHGRFKEVTKESGLDACGYTTAANAVDYDGDGRLDLVIGVYYKPVDVLKPATTRFMPDSLSGADNGGPIVVFHNDGGGRFSRAPGNAGLTSRGWTFAVGVYDLRGTGKPDLFLATDYGHDQVYLNDGKGGFENASARLRYFHGNHGMSAEIGDFRNAGQPAVFVSNIYEPGYSIGDNILWSVDGPGFHDVAKEVGVNRCGWGWGAKFADLDNDGWLDLVQVNGYMNGDGTGRKNGWQMHDHISRSAGRLVEDSRAWPDFRDSDMADRQTKCVFHNERGRFVDVAGATDLGKAREPARALAAIDYLNDGRLSLVTTSVSGPTRLYRNDSANGNAWIGFDLVGTRCNRDAFGSQVRLRLADGTTLTREIEPANGFLSQSDKRAHFGLGPAPKIVSARVRWADGLEQDLDPASLALGRYHRVTEPALAR